MRKPALRVALLRPGVAEIDVEAIHLARRKNLLDVIDIEDQQAHVRELQLRHLLRGGVEHILLHLNADEVDLGMTCGHARDEIALARAELDMQRCLALEPLLPMSLAFLTDAHIAADDERIEIMYGLVNPGLSP